MLPIPSAPAPIIKQPAAVVVSSSNAPPPARGTPNSTPDARSLSDEGLAVLS